jgi:D-alanyl-D-alanine-carboxypeptidase/D-alanyl-D-alanine-endopeptidase
MSGHPPATGEDFDRLVAAAAEKNARRHPGLVVGAVDAIRTQQAITGVGHIRLPAGPAPTDKTLWEIGSITKVFTGLLLAIAVVRREVTLDTPVRELLPAGATVLSRDGVEITLEHLTTHRSGLPRSPVGFRTEVRTVLLGRGNPYSEITDERMLEFVARTELRRTPGTGRIAYSNVGGALLGLALVYHAGASSYAELVRQRICEPLAMAQTTVLEEADFDQLATGYTARRRPVEHWTLTGLAGAGALVSSAADMLRFLTAQLRPESSELGEAITFGQTERYGGRRFGIGLGWIRMPARSGMTLWHNGGTGGFRSFAGIVPERGVGVVMLANSRRSCDRAAVRLLSELSGRR